MEVYSLNKYILIAEEHGIKIYLVPEEERESKSSVGIHLLMPKQHELEEALNTAIKDGFPSIYIHNQF